MFCILHILIVTYNTTDAVCYNDLNLEKTQGKFVRLDGGKKSYHLNQLSLGLGGFGDNKST